MTLRDGEIARANALYRSGAYREALDLYESIASHREWRDLVQANIALCRKRLRLEISRSQVVVPAASALAGDSVKLSIVVPVYNTGAYLEQCLRSILAQTERAIEVIVVNDGSSDNSLEIIERLRQTDARITLINNSKPSGNPGTPRNQGIAIAHGKYLGFVDSDDWVDPDYFERLLKVIEQDDLDIAFAAGYINHINGETKPVTYDARHFNAMGELRGYHESFMVWDKVYRTSFIKSHDIRLGETRAAVDVPFIFKAYYQCRKAGFADTSGYHYRRESASSVTVNFRKSSNCDFEIQAYRDVETWCRQASVTAQYQDLVKFRKVSSYIYTLRVISPEEYLNFFAKIKPELKAINRDLIERLSGQLNRPTVLERYTAIVSGDAEAYFKAYRTGSTAQIPTQGGDDKSEPESSSTLRPLLRLDGSRKGVLFFPDWSSTNPYQKLFYASLAQNFDIRVKGGGSSGLLNKDVLNENKEEFGYLHLHWLHRFMDVTRDDGLDKLLKNLRHARKLGYKIIYTAHNIVSHESEHAERELQFRRKLAPLFDHVLAHGELARQRLIEEIGIDAGKIHVMPHGTYQGYYKNHVTPAAAREKLGVPSDTFVFLFFGNIRGYKGIDPLMEAWKELRSRNQKITLLIAGRVWEEECEKQIRALAEQCPDIVFHPDFIADDEVQYYFNAADMVMLPYKRILTSGAAMLSFAFERPIIAPRSGLMPEFVEEGKHGWLFDDHEHMLALMQRCIDEQRTQPMAWIGKFDFRELNSRLRWPILTADPALSRIFGAEPKTEDYVQKRSSHRYALIRILGNDLPMRHDEEQTYNNLKFTLENEKEFDDCLKLWVLNRIVDQDKKQQLIDLLNRHGKRYLDLPFEPEEFAQLGYCFEDLPRDDYKLTTHFKHTVERVRLVADTAILRRKNNYIINNNGARNVALDEGAKHADWVFPWDGNCFVTEQAWQSITAALQQRADLQYHIVPMERLLDNQDALRPDHVPQPNEEPQIIFRKDATERFNEWLMYGLQPKVELLKRLGVPGVWDAWTKTYPWHKERMPIQRGAHTYNYSWAGWTARLFSGKQGQELDAEQRANMRRKGIISFISGHDRAWLYRNFTRDNLAYYDQGLLELMRSDKALKPYAKTLAELENGARKYLGNPLYSVIDKTTLPPSGNKHDYWHPAPYFWPNPKTRDGLPYVYKDGERIPGTRMYEPESVKYDRTSIQRVFDETTTLALAGYIFTRPAYTEKAAKLIRQWFINEKTSMNPNLTYSQVAMGRNGNVGMSTGLIETKDMYYFLDAVRLVRKSEFWRDEDEHRMQSWCKEFLTWLNTSEQGQQEVVLGNNHGLAFDLQTYALAAFIGDTEQMYWILLRALSRMKGHVAKDGTQPHEMKRTTTAHYTAFNLHLWLNLNVLLRSTAGYNLFDEQRDYEGVKLHPLPKAVAWVLDHAKGKWPYKQIDEFDKDRYQHLYHTASRHSAVVREKYQDVVKNFADCKAVFFPHDGIAPYWTLQN